MTEYPVLGSQLMAINEKMRVLARAAAVGAWYFGGNAVRP